MANYSKKEISEWNTKDLCSWLIDNKYPGISELCQNNSLSGYDLFFINDDILKNELNLNSFHERRVTMKLINKLINEHLKLNIINSNGDSVILTLDNNQDTALGELSEYIGGMFNMDPKDILYKDSTKKEVLSPTLKIVQLIILYPHLYKTLNVFNMKDYHQISENNNNTNENDNAFQNNENNMIANNASSENENESDFQDMERMNNMNYNCKMKRNFDNYNMEEIPNKRVEYNNENMERERDNDNMKKIIYKEDYDTKNMKDQKFRSEQRIFRGNTNIRGNGPNENSEEHESDYGNNRIDDNNDLKFRNNTNYRDINNNVNKELYSMRNPGNRNIREKMGQNNYNNKIYKNVDIREDYYNNALN